MSDDWQVGDLAVCVDVTPLSFGDAHTHGGVYLKLGRAYRVTACFARPEWGGEWCVSLAEIAWYPGFSCARFRKIRPDEHEDCEPEFVELLNRIKRKVAA